MKRLYFLLIAALALMAGAMAAQGRTPSAKGSSASAVPARPASATARARAASASQRPSHSPVPLPKGQKGLTTGADVKAAIDARNNAASKTARRADHRLTPSKPNLDSIRMAVSDPRSPYYYPKLMEQYERNETIMDLTAYRHLYYGYLFQEDFNPYRHSEYSTKNEPLYFKSNHTRAELDSIIDCAELALADTPFDLSQMNFLIYALRQRGKVNRASIWQYRLNHLLQAIVSSGTGADKENAWYVISPTHEYNIVNFQNAVARRQQYEEPYYDRIDVERDGGRETATYYFNIRNLLEEYYRKFPDSE